jgi:hypothetical protein
MEHHVMDERIVSIRRTAFGRVHIVTTLPLGNLCSFFTYFPSSQDGWRWFFDCRCLDRHPVDLSSQRKRYTTEWKIPNVVALLLVCE